MSHKRQKRFWLVTKYERGKETIVARIPTTHISDRGIQELIAMLYAHWLTEEDIVRSHLRPNVKEYYNHLGVRHQRTRDPISINIGYSLSVRAAVVRPGDPLWEEIERTELGHGATL
jgi:hypothetical protein